MNKFEQTMREIDRLLLKIDHDDFDKLNDLLGALVEEYEDLEEELEGLKEQLSGLEARTIKDFTDDTLPGIEPIHYKAENLMDAQLMEAFGTALDHLKPHDMLDRLETLCWQIKSSVV